MGWKKRKCYFLYFVCFVHFLPVGTEVEAQADTELYMSMYGKAFFLGGGRYTVGGGTITCQEHSSYGCRQPHTLRTPTLKLSYLTVHRTPLERVSERASIYNPWIAAFNCSPQAIPQTLTLTLTLTL